MTALIGLLTSQYTYVLFVVVMGIGLYMMVASTNLVKKVIGLNMFQTAIFLFFISTAYVDGGHIPVVKPGTEEVMYASPLPQVIILTAIVVGVALTAVALALIIRIYNTYGTLDETVLREVMAHDR